ncbi:hypothetical protein P7K49_025711 [Saguinus oedipus]|uniref:Uncharacterized protein n=1 Tax=Saguinus oedipus TaxID=9490 RepID=A0ABQ9UHX8_SAGOE|nr:hypothetical protein P7K49_025711 [Saguinus oedipus]
MAVRLQLKLVNQATFIHPSKKSNICYQGLLKLSSTGVSSYRSRKDVWAAEGERKWAVGYTRTFPMENNVSETYLYDYLFNFRIKLPDFVRCEAWMPAGKTHWLVASDRLL